MCALELRHLGRGKAKAIPPRRLERRRVKGGPRLSHGGRGDLGLVNRHPIKLMSLI